MESHPRSCARTAPAACEEHAEPLLKTLTRDGPRRLRPPTEVDWLQATVHDEALLDELLHITRHWRQPRPSPAGQTVVSGES